ncbi:helix-turn-helix transcriptional regulator [Halomicroarcula sp. F13]|uniref:Helix-turn-helix transcriptional regulator n=1 Tax=Haloarcula rubra TaxID=2487747 RepID=A0AAW4PMH8_9EURY|nr:helix-turn-helix domain-containing protein [Halomicroarcula rubra]MBX0322277.1 helix-turn-helix transcriptional regulator [Halomicroarcula rubra]
MSTTTSCDTHPAAPLFSLLGKAHTMYLLDRLVRREPRPWRFTELQRTLDMSPNTLSVRLDELVDAGLVTRTQYGEIPPRVEYEATEKAAALGPVFGELRDWARVYERPSPSHSGGQE